jgi:hypothetical protein
MKFGGTPVATTVRPVDLHEWMLTDVASVRGKLFDAVVARVPTDRWTEQVDGGGSSIAHLLLHLARHQDLAINTAIRNRPPVFAEQRTALGLDGAPAWAGLPEREDPTVSAAPSPDALLEYVTEVFDRTSRWLDRVGSMALDTIPATSRRLVGLADLPTDELGWLHSMWGGQRVSWLVQWPVIGHGHAHVGEAISVRNRMGLSPF